MAVEVVFDIEVNGGQSIKEVKELRKQFAEAEDKVFELAGAGKQNTKAFRDAALAAAKLKEEVDDINESLDDLKPEAKLGAFTKVAGGVASGFTAAAGAAALFGDESADLQKQLVKVQAAMAFSEGLRGLGDLTDGFRTLKKVILSNPLFLLVAVVTAVGAALFALKDKIPLVGDAFKLIGKAIDLVIDKLKLFSDWLGLTDFKADAVHKKALKRNKEMLESETKSFDKRIREAKRFQKETEQIEIEKAQFLIKSNNERIKHLKNVTKEEKKIIKEIKTANEELEETIKDLQAARRFRNEAEAEKRKADLAKKLADDARQFDAEVEQIIKEADAQIAADKKVADAKVAFEIETENIIRELDAQAALDKEEAKAKELADINEVAAARREAAANISMFAGDILQIQLNNAEKGSKEEEKLLKKQFQVNKAFQTANAVINGVQAIQAIQATAVDPTGITTALRIGASVALTAANLAKIQSARFQSSATVQAPSIPTISTPLTPAPVALEQTGSTSLRADGTVAVQTQQTPTIRAVVVETDITSTQDKVKAIEQSATFG